MEFINRCASNISAWSVKVLPAELQRGPSFLEKLISAVSGSLGANTVTVFDQSGKVNKLKLKRATAAETVLM